ncbi:MAG: TOPRIM nucleotidyl transferase/hydrolase domain-containing protein [Polyangiaceae bacterium]
MLFARKVLFVEGISEQTLLPRFFAIHTDNKQTFEGIGAVVVNVNGIAFRHFLTIVKNGLFLRCAVITDRDPTTRGGERATALRDEFGEPRTISVCISDHATFEKDIIAANCNGDGKALLLKALQATKPIVGKQVAEATAQSPLDPDDFFPKIEDCKAEFAFNLAALLDSPVCGFTVPSYIISAFRFLE